MNHWAMQQHNSFAACEEMRGPFAVADRKPPVFCPKPRRFSPLPAFADPVRPLRWHSMYISPLLLVLNVKPLKQQSLSLSLSLFFPTSNPSFFFLFCSVTKPISLISRPGRNSLMYISQSRVANPVVHDARFGEDRPPAPFAPLPLTQSGPPLSPSQGCAHAKFGLKPAAVRIEGFDCLDRDRRRCSGITAVA
ncbi:hypothetical protein GW17_00010250 [Ensete ventricosum]|nr:hypothetical protein GW17_00010250 [Ensete ventricosum]